MNEAMDNLITGTSEMPQISPPVECSALFGLVVDVCVVILTQELLSG
jgi:hypothetical protein